MKYLLTCKMLGRKRCSQRWDMPFTFKMAIVSNAWPMPGPWAVRTASNQHMTELYIHKSTYKCIYADKTLQCLVSCYSNRSRYIKIEKS